MPLSSTAYITFTSRRTACGMWPSPMLKPSPSPPTTRTVRSGREYLSPVAIGSARPWMELNA